MSRLIDWWVGLGPSQQFTFVFFIFAPLWLGTILLVGYFLLVLTGVVKP